MLRILPFLVCLLGTAPAAAAQSAPIVPWNALLAQPAAWYATPEAVRIADNLLLYQRGTGGWPKNLDMTAVLTAPERARLQAEQRLTNSTIDNAATTTEVLARVFEATSEGRFRSGALAGLEPIFVGRDGVKRDRLADIEVERRTGYSYLGDYARELLERDYPVSQAARRAASAIGTQTAPPQKVDLLGYLQRSQAGIAAQLLAAARMMPEADYPFTPSQMSGTRTFAGVMTHAAAGMFDACARAGGHDKPRSGIEGTLTRKDEVVAALAESIALCEQVFESLTEQTAAEYVRQGPAEIPRMAVLMGVVAHNAEMFGISTVYLRARNLLPPGSVAR